MVSYASFVYNLQGCTVYDITKDKSEYAKIVYKFAHM